MFRWPVLLTCVFIVLSLPFNASLPRPAPVQFDCHVMLPDTSGSPERYVPLETVTMEIASITMYPSPF